MSLHKRVSYTVFSNWTVLFLNILISFFLAPFIVHKLGNVYYGIWSIVMQFTGYLYLMDFGVRDSVIRYTSRLSAKHARKQLTQTLSTALILYSAIGGFSILIVILGAWFFPTLFDIPPELSTEVRIVVLMTGLSIAQTFVFNVFSGILAGLQRFYQFNVFQVVFTILRAALIVYLLDAGHKIAALSFVQLSIGFASGIVLLALAKHHMSRMNVVIYSPLRSVRRFAVTARRLFNYSVYVFVINIASKIIFATDALVIGLFMNVGQVTFYAIAGNLIEYLKQLMTTSSSVFNPVTSHLDALGKKAQVQEVLCTGSRFNLFIGLPIAVTYIFLGEQFIGLWMGPEYASQAGSVLLVLALTQLLSFHQHTISGVIFGLSKHKQIAYWRVAEAVANLALSIALIGPFGLVGVALGTAIPHIFVSVVVFPVYAARFTGITLKDYWTRAFLRPIFGIAPFALIAIWLDRNVVSTSLLEFFVYIFLMCLLYLATSFYVVLTPRERKQITGLLRSRLDLRQR